MDNSNILTRLGKCNTIITDIDGVLTDGMLLVTEGGASMRLMNVKDGYALQLAVKQGYKIIVISGAENDLVAQRLRNLGIESIYTKVKDKSALLQSLSHQEDVNLQSSVYIGDDNPDLEVMQLCSVSACPSDAAIDIQMHADYISPYAGGKGCVRDIIEKILRINDHWM